MFAIIKSGGKQYPAYKGKVIFVEKLESEVGSIITFKNDDLIMHFNDKEAITENCAVSVTAEVLEHKRGEKIIIFKKKRRKNYRRKNGHRQTMTALRIKEII